MAIAEDVSRPILLHVIISDSAVQASDGKTTIYGIFNRIQVKEVPTTHSGFTILTTVGYGRPGKYMLRIRILSPSNKEVIASPSVPFELNDKKAIHNSYWQFQGFPLSEEGAYRINVFLGDEGIPLEDRILFFVEKGK